ncbi:MAG TPA: hypothetical protein VGW57_14480 [Chthoniobacterales bacterium]|nr:hypothetical protein [Chthoniobacterales bacterium]
MSLFRILLIVFLSALAWGIHRFVPGSWYHPFYIAALALLLSFLVTWTAGNASRGVALRKVEGGVIGHDTPDPPAGLDNGRKWYVESVSPEKGLPHSCSFVEFDERGDYLDFKQHLHAYEKVRALAQKHDHLIVVIFVHGWRNNGQSGNVVDFNEFLHQLATHADANGTAHRVHGIYLSWRGACLKHVIDAQDKVFKEVSQRYRGSIVDLSQAARFPALNRALETLSYFDRKGVPEHLFSGTSLSRTLFTCAHVAKRYRSRSYVFLIGHSFGGLMLERTFQNAAIGDLISAWPWGDPAKRPKTKANPLPFDTVLLVNSAAPSIYAKQFQSFLAAHGRTMARDDIEGANSPVFFSLTSSGDWATGKTHRLANTFCFLIPTLRRKYRGNEFILAPARGTDQVSIQQSYYYRHTPGHNPLLVNRFIEPVETTSDETQPASLDALRINLQRSGGTEEFMTSPRRSGERARMWRITFPPATRPFIDFSQYKGGRQPYTPVVWESDSGNYINKDTAYWIIRCTKEIIKDHNDIWSQQAMDTYAALYAISLALRKQKPPPSTPP